SYDANGNRTKVQDSLGGVTSSTYDAANRLTQRQSGQANAPASLQVGLTYDAANQLTGLTRSVPNLTAEIWKKVNNNPTQLTSTPVTSAAGTLRLDAVGSALQLSYNGTVLSSTVDSSLLNPGLVGLRSSSGTILDNFSAGPQLPQLPFSDDFNRANSGTPGTHYTVPLGAGSVSLINNQLAGPGGSYDVAVYNTAAVADVSVQAVVSLGTSGAGLAGLVARYSGGGDQNMYYAGVNVAAGTYYATINKNVGGTWTQLA